MQGAKHRSVHHTAAGKPRHDERETPDTSSFLPIVEVQAMVVPFPPRVNFAYDAAPSIMSVSTFFRSSITVIESKVDSMKPW
jgi:hypothetical protein